MSAVKALAPASRAAVSASLTKGLLAQLSTGSMLSRRSFEILTPAMDFGSLPTLFRTLCLPSFFAFFLPIFFTRHWIIGAIGPKHG